MSAVLGTLDIVLKYREECFAENLLERLNEVSLNHIALLSNNLCLTQEIKQEIICS